MTSSSTFINLFIFNNKYCQPTCRLWIAMLMGDTNCQRNLKKWGQCMNTFLRCMVTSKPARGKRCTAWSRQYPSNTGTLWLTPSPESNTTPSVKERQKNLHILFDQRRTCSIWMPRWDSSWPKITSGSPSCVKCQHCLHGHVGEGNVETLKHDLDHALAILQRIHGCLSHQNRVILQIHVQLLERVVPNLKPKQSA